MEVYVPLDTVEAQKRVVAEAEAAKVKTMSL